MQSSVIAFKKIKDKLSPKQRVVLIYTGEFGNTCRRSIGEIAQLFGVNKEYVLDVLKSTYEKFPKEVSTILNLERV